MSVFSAVSRNTFGVINRHPKEAQKVMSLSYVLADFAYASIPATKLLHTHNQSWSILAQAYSDRPLPLLASGVMMLRDYISGKRFALGHAITGVSAGLMVYDLATHHIWDGLQQRISPELWRVFLG